MDKMRIAVSGTYSTGKTTTSYALSYLTGLERTHAQTMREILPIILPGKRLEDCTPYDLYELGIRRLTERVQCEAKLVNGFISDGSALHEWVYGRARMKIGLNPSEPMIKRNWNKLKLLPNAVPYMQFSKHYGNIVKAHVARSYDVFVHLPIEFPIAKDGHRPVNERFRELSDTYLLETIKELKIPIVTVSGSVENRLKTLIKHFRFVPKMSIDEALAKAKEETRIHNQIEIEYSNSLES